jgi:hypothetical protein
MLLLLMKYIRVFFLILIFVFSVGIIPVRAQSFDPFSLDEIATDSAEATMSAREATASSLVKRVVEKEPDITQDKPEVKGKLERYIEENTVGSLSPFNFMRHGIIYAVSQGVPANTIVLILLFPLVATLVIISRHVIGLKSFGIFTPALLAVAFLATGLITGILLFFVILAVATFIRMLLRETRIQYLPRMAIFMWFISMSIFGVLIVSPSIGIFPILILILSVEAFLDVQITRSFPQALRITFETLIVALGCFNLMNMESLQKFSLVHPELFTISILVVIAVVESYSGLRLLELWRFRKVIKP